MAAIGLWSLHRDSIREAEHAAAALKVRTDNLVGHFHEHVREGKNHEQRMEALLSWSGGTEAISGSFAWTLKNGIVFHKGDVPARLSGFTRWNEWSTDKKHPTKRGMLHLKPEDGEAYVLWARVDNALYGVVFRSFPVHEDPPSRRWPAVVALVSLLAGVFSAGLWLLVRAAAKARRDGMEKTTFVSNVSHELKTPLAAIRLWSDMMLEGRLKTPDKVRRACEVISDENRRMIRLVENLLDFSRLARHRRRYEIAVTDMDGVVRSAAALVSDDFAPGGLNINSSSPLPAMVDEVAARQIIVNLLSNAAKYASQGGPVDIIAAKCSGGVRVDGADRGPGLSPAARAHVFERFFRAEETLDANSGGLGLGLAISKALADDMDCSLSVDVRDGGGLVFSFIAPAGENRTDMV